MSTTQFFHNCTINTQAILQVMEYPGLKINGPLAVGLWEEEDLLG